MEPYSLDHVLLNLDWSKVPTWLNMGYWSTGETCFTEACETLADKVARPCAPVGKRLLILGHGCGDELAYYRDAFEPLSIYGVTSLRQHASIAQKKCPSAVLRSGDALASMSDMKDSSVDIILALDCIYHFTSRSRTFQEAARLLEHGGVFGASDILAAPNIGIINSILLWLVCLLTGVKYTNLTGLTTKVKDSENTFEAYEALLREKNFEEATIEDISQFVFGPLSRYILGRDARLFSWRWYPYILFALILHWWSKSGVVRFVVVRAVKS